MRIFIGTFEIAAFCHDLADAFHRLGHDVTAALSVNQQLFAELRYDADIGEDVYAASWPTLMRDFERIASKLPRSYERCRSANERIAWMIENHDVFVFIHASLWPASRMFHMMGLGREYPLLSRLGKRIVAFFNGPDVRHANAFDQESDRLGLDSARLCDILPAWKTDPLTRPLRNLRLSERYADVIFSQVNQAALAVRPYFQTSAPIQLGKYRFAVPGRRVPLVVHAPSDDRIKGTRAILAALRRLREEGVRFEIELLKGVPNREVRRRLTDADVLIDQIHLPMHGKLAVEGMASGCAVATCDRADLEPAPSRPLWHVSGPSLHDRLRTLLTDRALRVRLAHEGRAYAREHHGHVKIARDILHGLDHAQGPFSNHPEFYFRHYRLPRGEKVPPRLLGLTNQIVGRWGLPEDVDVRDLVRRGLVAPSLLAHVSRVPRWGRAPSSTAA
jgi:hypothetical protein